MLKWPSCASTPQPSLQAARGLSRPHLSGELRRGAGEPYVMLRVDLEALLMVAKRLVVMSPCPMSSFKVLLLPEMGPRLCPAPPHCHPWVEEQTGTQIAVPASCPGLGHLLLSTAGGVRGDQQPNLLHCSDYLGGVQPPFSPHSVLCTRALLRYSSLRSCFCSSCCPPPLC